jgi:hypothetical protein
VTVDDLPTSTGNRWRSGAFRSAVALRLRDLGVHDARLTTSDQAGDLVVPGWVMTARNPANMDLSTSLDEAVRAARAEPQAPIAVAILARRGRTLDEAYAVMRLCDLADVVARLAGTTGAPLSARVRPGPVEP